ncbi:MAG: NTP transferase domain-containing protein [Chloroflexi bacterium]|uniref:NTP transferase domain-containing protein n=1 Tax=Candidatus Chlorohelix allophototropha TaxID=3003348 RepID=A0A8T7M793_9CHLR|nr:NTP transferase domain-containing protein [Chloroflexota bacterium]WJW69893.1 NTP transferase domain-containing protein [Chloroflexota bacterium L227-S17]
MKIIIPLAGLGTRLRPHTFSKPKPLVTVAGKPVLGHILDELAILDVEEIIFIVGYLGDQIEKYVSKNYPQYKARYIVQSEMLGQAHAVNLAQDYIQGDVLIIFADTIFKTDLSLLKNLSTDGVIYTKGVEDPSRFGVTELDEHGIITRLVEKPTTFVSNLAVVGIYYFKKSEWLFSAINKQVERNIQLGGEYFLADAISIMIEEKAKFNAFTLEVWEDCGKIDALLLTNRYLLGKLSGEFHKDEYHDSVIVPPVYIAPDAKIERSVIGPYVSIAAGAEVIDSILRDCIINEKAVVKASTLSNSVIGSNASVAGTFHHLNVGDNSEIDYGE